MKVHLFCYFDHHSSDSIYTHVADELNKVGVEASFRREFTMDGISPGDIIIHHNEMDIVAPDQRYYGGLKISRPDSLALLPKIGIPTMPWAVSPSIEDAEKLFDAWNCDHMLLKRSYSFATNGTVVVTKDNLKNLQWTMEDVFCPILAHPDCFKIEAFNGVITITWVGCLPSLEECNYDLEIIKMADKTPKYRELCDYPPSVIESVKKASKILTEHGNGYMSFDFMKDESNNYLAIEANFGSVATWWTCQFPFVKQNFAQAVLDLLDSPYQYDPAMRNS